MSGLERESTGEITAMLPRHLCSLDDFQLLEEQYSSFDYRKLASIIRLRRAGLPTLPGFVTGKLSNNTLDFLDKWRESMEAERFSLRFDSPNPEDHRKLLGSNPTLHDLSQMKKIIKRPVIAIIMAENDRFNQSHSILTRFTDNDIYCEIVGPGFDAADITRGHISPHEIFEISRKLPEDCRLDLTLSDIARHYIIPPTQYQLSRQRRYGTIYSILQKGLGKSVVPRNLTQKESVSVESFLTQRHCTVPEEYQPLGYEKLSELYGYLVSLDTFRTYNKEIFGIDVSGKVLSASFLLKHGLVFWDLYGADKYTKH